MNVPDDCYSTNDFLTFDFDHTWWLLFQKRVVDTKLDIYVFITFLLSLNQIDEQWMPLK